MIDYIFFVATINLIIYQIVIIKNPCLTTIIKIYFLLRKLWYNKKFLNAFALRVCVSEIHMGGKKVRKYKNSFDVGKKGREEGERVN